MAKHLSALFGKGKAKPSYRPLKEVLEGKHVTFPLLLAVKSADLAARAGGLQEDVDIFLYIEQKTRLKYVRLEVVELSADNPHTGELLFAVILYMSVIKSVISYELGQQYDQSNNHIYVEQTHVLCAKSTTCIVQKCETRMIQILQS